MKKLLNWLFGSERSVKEMKSFASKDGNFCTEKSNKEKNNSDKGQFNIMVGYIEKFFGFKKRSEKKISGNSRISQDNILLPPKSIAHTCQKQRRSSKAVVGTPYFFYEMLLK